MWCLLKIWFLIERKYQADVYYVELVLIFVEKNALLDIPVIIMSIYQAARVVSLAAFTFRM